MVDFSSVIVWFRVQWRRVLSALRGVPSTFSRVAGRRCKTELKWNGYLCFSRFFHRTANGKLTLAFLFRFVCKCFCSSSEFKPSTVNGCRCACLGRDPLWSLEDEVDLQKSGGVRGKGGGGAETIKRAQRLRGVRHRGQISTRVRRLNHFTILPCTLNGDGVGCKDPPTMVAPEVGSCRGWGGEGVLWSVDVCECCTY